MDMAVAAVEGTPAGIPVDLGRDCYDRRHQLLSPVPPGNWVDRWRRRGGTPPVIIGERREEGGGGSREKRKKPWMCFFVCNKRIKVEKY